MALGQTDPCSLTATRTISNGQTVSVSTWFPSVSSTSNEVIDIGSGSTLLIDKDFTFNACKFRCAANALILAQSPSSGVRVLSILNSTLLSCNSSTMWKGIQMANNTRIRFIYNFIYDADKAIYFPGGYNNAQNELRDNRFIDNRIGIQVGAVTGSPANVAFTTCKGNKFSKTGLLNDVTQSNYPEAGILVNKSNLTFGTAGFRNIFEGLRTGITVKKGGYVWVANCDFKSMVRNNTNDPEFPLKPYDGTGIYVNSSHLTVTRISGGNCKFDGNASHGIYVENQFGSLLIERAEFTGGERYGIFIKQSLSPSPIVIQDNHFNLNHVRCYSSIFCERSPGSSSSANSYIRRNRIDMPLRSTPAAVTGSILDIVGVAGGTNTFEISKNRVNFSDWPNQDKNGIFITGNGDNFIVKQNRINFTGIMTTGVDYSHLGITFETMPGDGNVISEDTIRSILVSQSTAVGTNDRSVLKCGIHVNNAHAPTVCNNDIDSTYRAIHFGEMNMGTVFGLNKMRKHVYGAYFAKNSGTAITDISDQNRRGNTWSTSSGDYIDGGVGAIYVDQNDPPFRFRYDPNSGITGQVPPSAIPTLSSWFNPESGDFEPCVRVNSLFEDGEIAIAEGEYPYSTPAEDWDQQRYLYYKLLRNPGIESGVQEVEDFIGDKEYTSPHLFAKAQYDFESAFYADTTWQTQWDQLLANISAKNGRIAGLLTQLGLDTININQADADTLSTEWNAMAVFQDTLRALSEDYVDMRDDKLDIVHGDVGTFPSDEAWEKAWVEILEMGIRYGKGTPLDSLDRAKLIEISEACPEETGLATKATLAYMLPEDAHPFKGCQKGAGACEEERQGKYHQAMPSYVYPNPADKHLSVLLQGTRTGGSWRIRSISGRLLQEGVWYSGDTLLSIDVSGYNSGFYLFETVSQDGFSSAKKFAIVH